MMVEQAGHFYEITLQREVLHEATVRVFIPDSARTAEAQLAFAQAQALADDAWRLVDDEVHVADLSRKDRVTLS